MARPVNIKLIMDVYKKLGVNKVHKTVADKIGISESHVGRIAGFLVEEYFLVPQSLKSQSRFYYTTKRIPTPKILYKLLNPRKKHDEGSSLCGIHNLQYKSKLKSDVTQIVINWCKLITPKGTKKYLYPPNKNLKYNFNIIIHDGKNKKSVMFYLNRIHLTVDELPLSDEIIKERVNRIAYNVQHFFKIKLGMPKPVGKSKEYALIPKEKFLVDALEEITFEINSPVGTVKGDSSGNPLVFDGREIEFSTKDLAMTYANIIPVTHMIGWAVVDNQVNIENLESEVRRIKDMLSETKPMLKKIVNYIDTEEKAKEHYIGAEEKAKKQREWENRERGVI